MSEGNQQRRSKLLWHNGGARGGGGGLRRPGGSRVAAANYWRSHEEGLNSAPLPGRDLLIFNLTFPSSPLVPLPLFQSFTLRIPLINGGLALCTPLWEHLLNISTPAQQQTAQQHVCCCCWGDQKLAHIMAIILLDQVSLCTARCVGHLVEPFDFVVRPTWRLVRASWSTYVRREGTQKTRKTSRCPMDSSADASVWPWARYLTRR